MLLDKKNSNNNPLNQLDKEIILSNGLDIKDAPSWFPKAKLFRTNSDLIADYNNGEQYIIQDYFADHDLPSVQTENGLLFSGSVIEILAGSIAPGKFVQVSSEEILSIGEVSSISGKAKATRLDGNEFILSEGDPVFQGDTIEVSSTGAVGLIFLDKTTLSLSEGGKMILDELVYNPESGTGNMKLDILEGVFSFTSGEIAKIGPDAMNLETPVVTCAIRGTTVAGKAAIEGNQNSFTLLQDADGGVGEISLTNAGGTQVLGQVGATTSIASFNTPPPPPIILTATQIQANYGTALNVLPPTPAVAPTPQASPPPQEQQQEEVTEEVLEEGESDEEVEEVSEEVSGEDDNSEEGEEVLLDEGDSDEEELRESDEDLPEGEDLSEEEAPPVGEEGAISEDVNIVADEGAPPANEQDPPDGDQQAAREAFDTALAAGASPEQALVEAAAAGFDGAVPGGLETDSGPLGESVSPLRDDPLGGPIPSVTPIIDPLGGAPFAQTFVPGAGGPVIGSPIGPGTMNTGQGPAMGPLVGMGPAFNLGITDPMGQGPIGGVDSFIQGAVGFNETIFGMMGSDPYGSTEDRPIEVFFLDPSLYDDYKINKAEQTSSTPTPTPTLTGIVGTSSNDTLNGTNNDDTIHGLQGNDIIDGGLGVDTMNGGQGNDTYIIDNFNDIVNENTGEGTDTVQSSVTYTLSSDIENLTLTGSSNINGTGNELNNIIIGNSGINELSGGLGNDIFYFDGTTSFGDKIKDFSISDELRFNLTFDLPTVQYSVTRSHFYEHNSSSNLVYNSSSNGNELPYIFNFTKDTSSYLTKSFKSDVISSIRFTKATSGSGTEQIFIVGNGTDSAIWLWDDLSQGYGVSNNELTFIAELENFDNDTLSGSNIVLGTL